MACSAAVATPDPVSADRTAELLLWFFQEPARYRAEGRRRAAPLLDSEVVLKLALGRRIELTVPTQDANAAVKLQAAAMMYVRHIFFRPDATPYQTLGLAPGASPEAIKESFRLLMHLVHPDRQDARAVWPDSFAALANRAYGVLRNQDARARFDREAEARAAMARAMHRAAAASAASKMPVVQRPRPRFGGSGLLRRMKLPEWLTAGVGGYAREHPATIAFSVLIGAAVLTIGTLGREGDEGWLTRETQEDPAPAAPRTLAATSASATPAAFVAGVPESAATPGGGASPKRSVLPESMPAKVAATATTPDGAPPPASSVPEPTSIAGDSRPSPQAAPAPAPLPFADMQPGKVPAPIPPSENSVPVVGAAPAVAPALAPPVTKVEPGPESAPPPARAEQTAMISASAASSAPPASTEIETLFATFVETYERGRIDAFAALFDDDADTNLRHGRAAIRGEYDEIFRLSQWRKMQLTRVNWKRVGDRAVAKGEITVRIGWRDGREVEQRLALDMELVRRDGRVVIARLSQQPKT